MSKTWLIADRGEMLKELQSIHPRQIAVAYVGKDWAKLLGPRRQLKELVVAPVAGTSSKAVKQIAAQIGWENVHFLDSLHAKVYLGSHRAMFGSANLSSRALAAGGIELYELVTVTSDMGLRAQLSIEFERYRRLAIDAYGTDPKVSKARKLERLKALRDAQPNIDATQIKLAQPKSASSIAEFEVGSRAIHLEWWDAYAASGEKDDTDHLDLIVGKRSNEVRVGDWVLEWRCTPKGNVGKKFELAWLRIDAVRLGRNRNSVFVDQVAERHEPPSHHAPFQIDDRVRTLFQKLIRERDDLRPVHVNEPMATPSRRTVDAFLSELKARYVA